MHKLVADTPEEQQIRAALTLGLERWLGASGLTQTAAAAVLGTTQARVSEIKHGKTGQFSLDLLVRLAARAGLRPRMSLASHE
jgi:predicted XRE-type DNA-binding protein